MKREITTRMLGCAEYEAQWIGKGLTVRLTARGYLPCANHLAQLEKRSDATWETIFYTQEDSVETFTPFKLQVIVMVNEGDTIVSVMDALGEHRIKIAASRQEEPEVLAGDLREQFLVYFRKDNAKPNKSAYFMVPVGTKVLPIFKRAYGPSHKHDCNSFIDASNFDFLDELALIHDKLGQANDEGHVRQ